MILSMFTIVVSSCWRLYKIAHSCEWAIVRGAYRAPGTHRVSVSFTGNISTPPARPVLPGAMTHGCGNRSMRECARPFLGREQSQRFSFCHLALEQFNCLSDSVAKIGPAH